MKKVNPFKLNRFKLNFLRTKLFSKVLSISLLLVLVPLSVLGSVGVASFSNTLQNVTISHMQNSVGNKLDLLQHSLDDAINIAYSTSINDDAISIMNMINSGEAASKANEVDKKKAAVSAYLKDIVEINNGSFENML